MAVGLSLLQSSHRGQGLPSGVSTGRSLPRASASSSVKGGLFQDLLDGAAVRLRELGMYRVRKCLAQRSVNCCF